MKRILIIDDERIVCSFFEKILSEQGYEVISALDARAGLRLVKKRKPDLVIIDLSMPGINGIEGLRLIKETSDIPVIIVTGYGTMETVREAMRLGAYDYITKPFRVKELISRINAVLRRYTASANEVKPSVKFGDIMLNLLEHKLYKDGSHVALTPTEFELIAVMMQNPCQILNRSQILEKLWDIDGEFIDDNALSVYIRRIREKIENNPSFPEYIVTARGFGYKCC